MAMKSAAARSTAERPYRSHLLPACLACRKRKSRCKVGEQASKCLLCSFHGTDCLFPTSSEHATRSPRAREKELSGTPSPSDRTRVGKPRRAAPRPPPPVVAEKPHGAPSERRSPGETPFSTARIPLADTEDESHVVGPVLGPDAQPIVDYLSNEPSGDVQAAKMVRSFPEHFIAGQRPIMFSTVRRRPLGAAACQTTASLKYQTVEKLIDPFCTDLVDLYFEKVHACLPLLDEASLKKQFATERQDISPALLSCLFAHTMVFWKQSLKRSGQHCPDIRFIWNRANEALYSELHLSPGISTVIAVLLNISGRPLTSMLGNGAVLGSAVSMAHSLGLNRDPRDWNIPLAEKRLRTRIWWVIVIFDSWSSVAYGTPPRLKRDHYDVPLPVLHDDGDDDPEVTPVFAALVRLTEELDVCLEYVFHLPKASGTHERPKRPDLDSRLVRWEDSLPSELRRAVLRGVHLRMPGSANLRLAYLYIKLLGRKLELDDEKGNHGVSAAYMKSLHVQVRRAAEEIVLFVQELDEPALNDFWLSLSSFVLSSTLAFLLRCALETERDSGGFATSVSVRLAQDMIATLRSHRQQHSWDLGDICLVQYSEVVEKLTTASDGPWDSVPALEQLLTFSFPGIDEPAPSLWDWFEGTEECQRNV